MSLACLGWAWVGEELCGGGGQRPGQLPAVLPRPRLGPCLPACCSAAVLQGGRAETPAPLAPGPVEQSRPNHATAAWGPRTGPALGAIPGSRCSRTRRVFRYHSTISRVKLPDIPIPRPTPNLTPHNVWFPRIACIEETWVGANAGLGFENVQAKSILGENQEASPAEHKPPARRRPFSKQKTLAC